MSPFLSDPLIELTVASNARPAAAFEMSACLAIASISSDLFTGSPCRIDIPTNASERKSDRRKLRTCFIAIAKTSCQEKIAAALNRGDFVTTSAMRVLVRLLLHHDCGFFDRCCGNRRGTLTTRVRAERRGLALQCLLEHLLDPAHRVDLEPVLDVVWNLDQVLHVFFGNEHALDPAAARREELLLQPADRQHFAAQRDFAGHRHVRAHRNTGKHRNHRGADAYPRTGAVLR